jgi:hypothetical protein
MRGIFNAKKISTMFSGGIGYGDAQQVLMQNICQPLVVVDIFYGGLGYGDQQKNILQLKNGVHILHCIALRTYAITPVPHIYNRCTHIYHIHMCIHPDAHKYVCIYT